MCAQQMVIVSHRTSCKEHVHVCMVHICLIDTGDLTRHILSCCAAATAAWQTPRCGRVYGPLDACMWTCTGLATAADLRRVARASLVQRFGARLGEFLFQACRGEDATPVKPAGPPKAVTVEDSFKSCTTHVAARHVLAVLAPDLLARLAEDAAQHGGRAPATLTVKWRCKGQGWGRTSASAPMPRIALSAGPGAAGALVDAAAALLVRCVGAQPFHLTLLNLGATGFSSAANPNAAVAPAHARLLGGAAGARASPPGEEPVLAQAAVGRVLTASRRDYGAAPRHAPVSKQEERRLHEAQAGRVSGVKRAAGGQPVPAQASAPASPAGSVGEEEDDFWGGLRSAACEVGLPHAALPPAHDARGDPGHTAPVPASGAPGYAGRAPPPAKSDSAGSDAQGRLQGTGPAIVREPAARVPAGVGSRAKGSRRGAGTGRGRCVGPLDAFVLRRS